MAGSRIDNLIRFIRRVAAPANDPTASDAQLLERYAFARDETAFELLARRHGQMVLGVCRRVLGDAHDAEDAFQATFLVLARKAASAARYRSAGGWLYTVAYRVALRARARRAVRVTRELPLDEPPPAVALGPASEAAWREVRQVIDEEVSRLPEKYRAPFVLFHLEGRSTAEVAQELGCPVGTVESHLSRARQRLRARLLRRGLAPTPALFAALAPQEAWLPHPAVQVALAVVREGGGAVSAEAAVLAGEVVRSLGIAKPKMVILLLAVAMAGAASLAAATYPRAEFPVRPEISEATPLEKLRPAEQDVAVEPMVIDAPPQLDVGEIHAVALSPDGKILAVGDKSCQLKLWNVDARKEMAVLAQRADGPEWILCLAFSPDGKILASGGVDRHVTLWDVAKKEWKVTLNVAADVYAVAFSPDGKFLASAGGDYPRLGPVRSLEEVPTDNYKEFGQVKVWDLATKEPRTFFRSDAGRIMSVVFSPDGKTLAAAGRNGEVRLWDVTTGKERACFHEDNCCVNSVAFSPDGKTLASGSNDGTVKLWDLASGRVESRLKGHTARVKAVAFSPNGRILATVGDVPSLYPVNAYDVKGEVRLWDAATGKLRCNPLTVPHVAESLSFDARRGKYLAVGGYRVTRPNGSGPGEVTLWKMNPFSATDP
jgi:RNA polymerase sigma factor (sigma-70 family)